MTGGGAIARYMNQQMAYMHQVAYVQSNGWMSLAFSFDGTLLVTLEKTTIYLQKRHHDTTYIGPHVCKWVVLACSPFMFGFIDLRCIALHCPIFFK